MSTTVTFEHFVGKTLIKIESAVAEQTKKCAFFFFFPKHSASGHLPPGYLKGYLKTHFEFSFGINISFIYSNSP